MKQKVAIISLSILVAVFAVTSVFLYLRLIDEKNNFTTLYNNSQNYSALHMYSNDDYTTLYSQYDAALTDKYWLQIWLAGNNSQVNTLNTQITNLNSIINLEKTSIWINHQTISQPASSYTSWTPHFSASYAGYVSVVVHTSSSSTTYVQVIYSSHGVDYDSQIVVGTGGTAVFPILPSSNIEIRIGNTNLITGHTQTVTITYYY